MGAAVERGDPGNELGEGKRLGQVVIGAQAQTLDPVVDRGRGREHEHPTAAAGGDEFGAHVVAVQAGQIPVEHDHVVVADERAIEPCRAVVGDIDGHLRPAQAHADRVGQLFIVFDHQDAHRHPSPRAHGPIAAGAKRQAIIRCIHYLVSHLSIRRPRFQRGYTARCYHG